MVALVTWLLDCLFDVSLGAFRKMDLGGSRALVCRLPLWLWGISRRKSTFMFVFLYTLLILYVLCYVLGKLGHLGSWSKYKFPVVLTSYTCLR